MTEVNQVLKYRMSTAVMAIRSEKSDSLDFFPTPPWSTRAFLGEILSKGFDLKNQTVLEPSCGEGHMSEVLKEHFSLVHSADIHDYGYEGTRVSDFLTSPVNKNSVDWVITNPPFNMAEAFVHRALPIARIGVAILCRTVFLETKGRYERLFESTPPAFMAQYTERLSMFKNKVSRSSGVSATAFCWMVWLKGHTGAPEIRWIAPCRAQYDRDSDYHDEAPKAVRDQTIKLF